MIEFTMVIKYINGTSTTFYCYAIDNKQAFRFALNDIADKDRNMLSSIKIVTRKETFEAKPRGNHS